MAFIFSNKKFILSIGNFISKDSVFYSYDWNQIYWKSVDSGRKDYLTPTIIFSVMTLAAIGSTEIMSRKSYYQIFIWPLFPAIDQKCWN